MLQCLVLEHLRMTWVRSEYGMVGPFGEGGSHLVISAMSLLPLENVLRGLCKVSLPLNNLLSGQLERGKR